MSDIIRFTPAVFAVKDTYQIMVMVESDSLMWVKVGENCYYDDSNGVMRSSVRIHRMIVPAAELEKEGSYTVCFRKMVERRVYFSATEDVVEKTYDFYPVKGDKVTAYHISDAHGDVSGPVKASELFREKFGNIDFLILNGDICSSSGSYECFDIMYDIISKITKGNIPVVFSRGNHDMRGILAENLCEYTPTDRGCSYYTFRLGNIWGILLDCGEDKLDSCDGYGNTICCASFREKETEFLRSLSLDAAKEYEAEGVCHKIVVSHMPFTHKNGEPFNIEEDRYAQWAKILADDVKPEIMLCGHTHVCGFHMPGSDYDDFGQPCPILVGACPVKDGNPGVCSGIMFGNESIDIVILNGDEVIAEHKVDL